MRKKRQRFLENALSDYVIEPGKPLFDTIRGAWHTAYFENRNPITLELGCGQGVYTIGLAARFPGENFIGIDIKGDRIAVGSQQAMERQLRNVAFLRTQIDHVDRFFTPNEVAQLYITFPDPRPKVRDVKRRLTHPRFLALYRTILQPGGRVHLKTDNEALFAYTRSVLAQESIRDLVVTNDLYASALLPTQHGLQTPYEKKFLATGKKIHYLCFSFV